MRRVTFPYMGTSVLAFTRLVEDLGHQPVPPPRPSRRTLDLGVKYAPEFACLPFKILLGSYLEALEAGATTIVTTGGVGPCRAGLYGVAHREILKGLGHTPEFIVFEPVMSGPGLFWANLRKLSVGVSLRSLASIIRLTWERLLAFDRLESLLHYLRPRVLDIPSLDRTYNQALEAVAAATHRAAVALASEEGVRAMRRVPADLGRRVVRVGIVGEIYVVLEPAANLNIERHLGELGAEVHRSIFLTGYARENAMRPGGNHDIKGLARAYVPQLLGGHGQETIGHTVAYAREGVDGVVQLAPFSCIPEIVARGILPRVSEDHDIPVISFFLDEQTGEAGMRTRLEAFVDLLSRRQHARRAEAT
ncbi:MAG: CoA protein activase [Bacillota bacterium]